MIDQAVPRFHAAVDLGASSGRVMLGRWADGRLELTEVHRFPNGPITQDGRLRWDAEHLFEETLVGLAEAVRIAAAAGGVLDGIGVDSWGVDIALVGVGTGTAFPTVPHHRGADADGPARAAVLVDAATAYAMTGVLEQTINTSYQLRSRAEELDARRADGDRPTVLLVPDLWVWLLTGVVGAERTIASTTQLLDQGTGDWAAELIRRWGLDGFDFPPVVAPGTVVDPTTPEVTARLGSSVPIPVHRVAEHDTASALAFARPDGAELLVSSGSWSLVGVCLPAPVLTEHARTAGFTNEAGVSGSSLLLRNLAGMWLLTECARAWSAEDGSAVDLVELVSAATAEAETDEDVRPAVFDVADPRLLVPGDMPERIATLCRETGQRPPSGRSDTVRSVVESLAVAYAETVRACEAITGVAIRSVRIVGGGSRNRLLCARTAARTGLPVTAGPAEASALGNLAVQLVAAGHAPSLDAVYRHGQDDHDHDHERTPT
ncbi:rhamnulokinase [Plantibacter sp. VKM Ac-2885]|uniref:rhamnulokinase n=1 Tax=Plantibacter sp. VKM Ac-2885 TaxID=2783828 RepID=UPI00188AA5A5|nr:FGGY-family carbohydrate kinase [Plantibacter sp. VKM Ac-2885]MBF4514286.1 rhamnulokinase [Plantibacter sp. VKM Ac-2885]